MGQGITITFTAETQEAVAKMQEFFGDITERLDRLAGAGDFLQGLGKRLVEAFTIGAIVEQFDKAIESAEEFGSAIQKTGLSIKALNALKFMGEETSPTVPFQEEVAALSLFNDKIYMAARLGGDAARVFRDLKVNFTDLHGSLLPTEAVLQQVMDRFSEMPPGMLKNAAAMELFGRSGRELIGLLNQGSAAMEEMKQKGGGITREDIEQAENFHRALVQLKEAWQQIFLDLLPRILPALKEFIEYLKDGALAMELGKFADFFELSMKSAIQDVSNFFANEIAKWSKQVDELINKTPAGQTSFGGKVAAGAAGVGTGLLALWDLAGAKVGIPGADEKAQKRIEEANAFFEKAGIADGILNRAAQAYVDGTKGLPNEYKSALNKLREEMRDAKAAGGISKGGRSSAPHGTDEEAAARESSPESSSGIISEEAKKMMQEIDKAYTEATQGKLAMLDKEREELLKKLKLELNDVELFEKEKAEVEKTYAIKRQQLQDQMDAAKTEMQEKNLHISQQAVQGNPQLNDLEKTRQLIPLLQQELALTEQNIALESSRAKNPGQTDEQKLQAEKQMLQLKEQELKIQQQLQQLNSQNFSGQMQNGLVKLQSEWGNLGQNLAGGALKAIQTGVDGITTSIMGALEHTRSWGAVFQQIGRSIIASIIQIVVQWVASMTIIAALKAVFKSKDAADSSSSAAGWAPAAIAASIASYGSAAAVGAAAFSAALIAGTAIAAGMSGVGGMESGGIIKGGKQLKWVNESGTEAVINAKGLQLLGPDFINAVNSGALSARDLHNQVAGSLPRPITSDAGAFQQMVAQGAAARSAAAGGNVNVQGHQLTAVFPRNNQELMEYMKSAEGEKIIVDTAKRRRMDIGVRS